MKKIMVTGGRKYTNTDTVSAVFNTLLRLYGKNIIIIHGDARGADRLCANEANSVGVHTASVPALWDYYRKSAGPIRNGIMVSLQPSLVVAFPGGIGTQHATDLAISEGIETWIITDDIVSYEVEKVWRTE